MLFLEGRRRAPLLAAHVTDFRGVHSPVMWRHSARQQLIGLPGLVFAKAMPFIGSRSSAGFGAGVPAARRQVLLTAWRTQPDFEAFLAHPIAKRLTAQANSWWALFEVASTRGSHYGVTSLSPTDVSSGAFAVLTLGRIQSRDLVRFLREGTRLGAYIRGAPGLITAYSAGVPLTGNCTVSIWESEEDMIRFAYPQHRRAWRHRSARPADPHRATQRPHAPASPGWKLGPENTPRRQARATRRDAERWVDRCDGRVKLCAC